jgi:hypothetical protein
MAFVGSLSSSIGTTTIAVTGSLVPGTANDDLGTTGSKWRTVFATNITGSLTRLAGGGEYLKPGSNVTLTTGSDGSVTIAAAGGGGGTSFFTEDSLDKIFTTGSVAVGFNGAASTKGSDVFFAVSSSNPAIAVSTFSGAVVASGSLTIKDAISNNTLASISDSGVISGSALQSLGNLSVQGTSALIGNVTVTGNVAVNGGDITTSAGTFNIAASTATTVNIGSAATKVVVPGDLEVQGTTITANVSNITIEDPLIGLGFTSGSVASAAGDRGFIGGIDGIGNNVAWAWSNSNSAFVATRTTSTSGSTTVTISGLQPIRASKLEVNGTNAYVTSSDGDEIQVVASKVATVKSTSDNVTLDGATNKGISFNIAGAPFAELKNDGSNTQFGAFGSKELTVSGSTVSLNTGGTVNVLSNGSRIGQLGGNVGNNFRVLALDTAGATKGLVLTGSSLDLGANSFGINLNFADSTKGTFTAGPSALTLGTPSGVSLTLSGANGVSLIAGPQGATFIKEFGSTGHLVIEADGPGDARIRATADLVLGSAGEEIKFQNASTTVLTLNTNGGNANFKGASNQQVTIGSDGAGGVMTVSGSTVTANAGAGGFVFQRDGVAELLVNALSNTTTVSGSASQNVTLAAGTGATTLTLSGSTVEHQATIAHKFNLGGALIAHVTSSDGRRGFFPASDSQFDLGGPSIRWQNIYTGDLHLRNERGDYTLIEESDFLSIRFNKNGKRYKFLVERVPELDER